MSIQFVKEDGKAAKQSIKTTSVSNKTFDVSKIKKILLQGKEVKTIANMKANVLYKSRVLPKEYTQLNWIIARAQYIDTLITPNVNTKITCEFRVIDASYEWGLMSAYSSWSWNVFCVLNAGNRDSVMFGSQTDAQTANDGKKHKIVLQGKSWSFDDKSVTTDTTSLWPVNRTLVLGDFGGHYFNGYLYSFLIEENGVKLFNGIPARRDSDGMAGMYDLVSKTFFVSKTTTNFTPGPPVIKLPKGYSQCEYIYSNDGKSFINTKCKVGTHPRIRIDGYYCTLGNSCIFMLCDINGTVQRGWTINPDGSMYYEYGSSGWNGTRAMGTILGQTMSLDLTEHMIRDAIEYGTAITNWSFNTFKDCYLRLWATRWNGSNTIRMGNIRLYDNDTLVRDYIPCYSTIQLKYGLYDLISKQFYASESTSDFYGVII